MIREQFKFNSYNQHAMSGGVATIMYTYRYLKGTVTQDLIWLKVVSLDRSWLVGLTEDL